MDIVVLYSMHWTIVYWVFDNGGVMVEHPRVYEVSDKTPGRVVPKPEYHKEKKNVFYKDLTICSMEMLYIIVYWIIRVEIVFNNSLIML